MKTGGGPQSHECITYSKAQKQSLKLLHTVPIQ